MVWTEETRTQHHIDALRELVEAGKLEITYVVGPARTVTTALSGVLGQSEDVGVRNVFHERFSQEDFLGDVQTCIDETPEGHIPHIVIKEMSDDIASPELAAISKHVIVTSREPVQHCISKIGIKLHADNMADISAEDIKPDTADDPDAAHHTETIAMLSNAYKVKEQTDAAREFLDEVRALAHPPAISVVEGDLFRTEPEMVVPVLCERSGVSYCPDMLWGWKHKQDICDAWTQTYEQSNHIMKPVQHTLPSNQFHQRHPDLQAMLQNYYELMSSPETVKPSLDEFIHETAGTLCGKDGDIRFDHLEPITAYAIASSYTPENDLQRMQQDVYLSQLRERFDGEHAECFASIDLNRTPLPAPSNDIEDVAEHGRGVVGTAAAQKGL